MSEPSAGDFDSLFGDDESLDESEIVDSVKDLRSQAPSDGDQRTEMVEDMSPEKGPFGGSSEAAPLLVASGWHPFMHFFVKMANMLHGSAAPCDRVGMLKAEHPVFFRFSWIADEVLEIVVVILSVVFISLAVEKAVDVGFPFPRSWW